jgi:hypothetical protein
MRRTLLAAFCIILGIGVSTRPQTKTPSKTTTSRIVPYPPDANPQYFPNDAFRDPSKSDSFDGRAMWYSKHLRAMTEPSLLEASKDKTLVAYRFLWLRTRNHPIATRLTIRSDGTGFLTGKMASGTGGHEPGILSQNSSIEVPKLQVQQFLSLLQKAEFWAMQSEKTIPGKDGAEWILEGTQGGNYHVVDRWSPENDDYSRVCLYLLELSKISVPAKEIY